MRKLFKLAVFCFASALALPVVSQETDEFLKPSSYKAKSTRQIVLCWGEKVTPSFSESYEIKCLRYESSMRFCLELKKSGVQNADILDIDESLAYQIGTMIDAAVYSSSNLPDKEWISQKLEMLKADDQKSMVMSVGLDGTTYNFYNKNYGASCWTPHGGNNAALVALGSVIYDAIINKDVDKIKSQLPQINSLTRSYASLMPEPYREYYLLRIDKKPYNWWSELR